MKIWIKLFTYTFILFEIIFNTSAYFIIEESFNQNLEKKIAHEFYGNNLIKTAIQNNLDQLEVDDHIPTGCKFRDQLKVDSFNYINKINLQNSYFEIYCSNLFILSGSLDLQRYFNKYKVSLNNLDFYNKKYIINTIGTKKFLFMINQFESYYDAKIIFAHNITDIYDDRYNMYIYFLKLDIITAFVLILSTIIFSKNFTKPIYKLTEYTRVIATGDYESIININSKDEIGILSNNFNLMILSIKEKIEQLKKITEEKQRFIENLTHELKTPLTSIIGYADLLRMAKYNENIFISSVNYIYNEGLRLQSLCTKMMDLIYYNKNGCIKKQPEDLQNIFKDVFIIMKPKLVNKHINLICNVVSEKIIIDKDLFIVLLTNLIDNAIKASYENETIYLNGYKSKSNQLIIDIIDNGIGIKEDDIQKIFEPFYMADKIGARLEYNVGLGLSLCLEIATLHGIKIELKSKINHGTKVQLIFS